ncbi:DUF2513 domain-containing protein [Brevibacillus brevis X23]|nr:DUF2513 domain-containing protein [Brevibacillus brevis X23]
MKRSFELVVEILRRVEVNEEPLEEEIVVGTTKYMYDAIQYHVALLVEAGYLKGRSFSSDNETYYHIDRLTWKGHDFLDATRNEQVVKNVKESIESKGFDISSLPFDVAKDLLVEGIKNMFGM